MSGDLVVMGVALPLGSCARVKLGDEVWEGEVSERGLEVVQNPPWLKTAPGTKDAPLKFQEHPVRSLVSWGRVIAAEVKPEPIDRVRVPFVRLQLRKPWEEDK